MTAREDLEVLVATQFDRAVSNGAQALAAAARRQRPGALAVVFYGSCLRDANDDDAVLDLYVLVESYEATYDQRLLAWLNRVLPPNVFFIKAESGGATVRAKYAVVTLDSFAERMADTTRESYFWARFAQPSAVVYAATPEVRQRLAAAFATAVETFVRNALPLVPARFSTHELWATGLSRSYESELRAEGPDRSAEIFARAAEYYEQATRLAFASMPFEVVADDSGWRAEIPAAERARSLRRWRARRVLSKLLTALRVLRNWYTAEGGVDYVMWKIQRHSGFQFDEQWRDKPVPLFALLHEIWRAWRAGAFR